MAALLAAVGQILGNAERRYERDRFAVPGVNATRGGVFDQFTIVDPEQRSLTDPGRRHFQQRLQSTRESTPHMTRGRTTTPAGRRFSTG